MKINRRTLASCRTFVVVIIAGSLTFQLAPAQSQTAEKPTLKEFGSSLKRLKWDPIRQAVVESASAAKQPSVPLEDVIRIDTELVVCDVLIRDGAGRVVQDLTQNDFVVAEDDQPQQISHFSIGSADDLERSIVLIVDYSSSQLPYIRNSIAAARTLVDKLGPKDRMAIVTDDVELLVDYTSDKSKLKYALEDLRQRATLQERYGRSDQFTALLATARELFSSEDLRRVVIFQTDGDELHLLRPFDPYHYFHLSSPAADASDKEKRRSQAELSEILMRFKPEIKEFGANDVYDAVEKSRATVYSVIPGVRFIGLSPEEQLNSARNWAADNALSQNHDRRITRQMLFKYLRNKYLLQVAEGWTACQSAVSRVATITGGFTSFLENPNQAEEIYSRILSDVNSRYVIGYYPANKIHDGKRRKVLIQVASHPEYTVEGRKTYFAPRPEQ